ncbi:MAG: UPF0182 family protein [Gemmatimonadaceae bacterium]|nr:UPF0182 family protein [Gemmatimonadaceae bacterium]
MSIPIRWRRWPVIALAVVAALLVLGRVGAAIVADYLWYAAMGAAALWRERALLMTVICAGSALVAAAILFVNLYVVRQSVVSLVLPRRVANIEIGEEVPGRYLVGAALAISLVLGWWLSLPAESWRLFSLLRHGLPFGEIDPYMDVDIGFYVYWLPIESMLYYRTLTTVLFATVVVIFFYALTPSLRWDRGALYVSHYVRRHLTALGAVLLLLLAWSYRLDIYEALLFGSGPDGAFSFSDHRTIIPISIWLAYLTAGTALVVFYFGWIGQVRAATMTLIAVLLISVLLRHVTPVFMRRYVAAGGESAREQGYLSTRAEYTRRAYALQRIDQDSALALPAHASDVATDVSVWDPTALMHALGRRAAGPSAPGTIQWSTSPDGLRATVVERPVGGDVDGERADWSMTRLFASRVENDGALARVPASRSAREPEQIGPVLVADSLTGYRVVSDSVGVIAAPALDGTLPRVAFAWALQNFRLLTGELPRPVSRIVTHRDLRDRLDAVAPYFLQGSGITPIVVADSLYWAIDLYSASNSYPLSERDSLFNTSVVNVTYLQHAGVGVANALTGAVWVVADSAKDPISESWFAAFPSLFVARNALPPGVANALPPPVDAARVQGHKLASFGLRGEVERHGHLLAEDVGSDTSLSSESALFALPGTDALQWSGVVVDPNEHPVGVLLASGGAEPAVHWLLLGHPGARWSTIAQQLRRSLDTTVSAPRDAHAVHGRVRMIPLAGGQLLYVQPLYGWRTDGATLLAVAATTDTVVTAAHTLADALGSRGAPTDPSVPIASADFRTAAEQLYEKMSDAMRRGDWVAFGHAYDALGALLNRSNK